MTRKRENVSYFFWWISLLSVKNEFINLLLLSASEMSVHYNIFLMIIYVDIKCTIIIWSPLVLEL